MTLLDNMQNLIDKSDELCGEVENLSDLIQQLMTYQHQVDDISKQYEKDIHAIFDIYGNIRELIQPLVEDGKIKTPSSEVYMLNLIAIEHSLNLARTKQYKTQLVIPKFKPKLRKKHTHHKESEKITK